MSPLTNEQKLGSESAFPLHDVQQPWDSAAQCFDSIRTVITGGLTKRELFAAIAMQSILTRVPPTTADFPRHALTAVIAADALLTALDQSHG